MKYLLLLGLAVFTGCAENKEQTPELPPPIVADTSIDPGYRDSIIATPEPVQKKYSNKRFRAVTVIKKGDVYQIQGQGQIFEASFNWVVEDGHNEIQKGHEMTDAGAPEWGRFNFTVNVKKPDPNTVLHLILYESSAMDGSRQHELPIPLQ